MSHVKKPHTVIAFTRNGKPETIGRPGMISAPDAAKMLAARGITGAITIRHHAASMFGKPGATVAVFEGRVGR